MAEGSRRYALNQQPLEISQILLEAQHRWLRPSEVCEILRNYQNFQLTPDPPHKPPGGSLFLFDRKALRYFRKDGHQWRKKKDGKTVREAHEKLKAGSVDVLHCYYAHGEDNENFQRRSYWMLDGQLEHIVLVHYREVKEGNRSGIPRLSNANSAAQTVSFQNGSAHCPVQDNRSTLTVQAAYASSPSTANWSGQTPSSEVEDVDSGDDLGTSSFAEAVSCSGPQNVSLQAHDTPGLSELPVNYLTSGLSDVRVGHEGISSMWTGFQSSGRTVSSMHEQCINFDQLNGSAIVTRKPTDAKLDTYGLIKDNLTGVDSVFPDGNFPILNRESRRTAQGLQKNGNPGYVDYLPSDKGALTDVSMFQVPHEHDLHLAQNENDPGSSTTVSANEKSLVFGNIAPLGGSCNDQSEELKKLDSFGRWMNKEIGGDCDDALMASDSGNYWNSLDAQNDDKEVSSLSLHLLDVDSLGPSLSRDQLFSICDYSPDWALSGVETKVLITGKFLENVKLPDSTKWCCMFGEVEVSAEVLSQNVLRCQVPSHAPGRVPFYITCSNRLACSEVREFEFLKNPPGVPFSIAVKNELEDEMRLQIRFAKMLYLGSQKKRLDCSVEKCEKCSVKNDIFSMGTDDEKEWGQIVRISMALEGTHGNPQEALIQKLLKDRLYEWLVCKVHEEGKGPNVFDDGGQGLIHLAAALGYEWAIGPMVAAGIKPNFRDARGRTALHWAAYFGREETVVALVRLGATPGSVEDPTPQFPGGRTAADLASSRGHKGIAGYLAEADLTSYLASLTIKENVMDGVAATPAADEAIETEEEQHVVSPDGRMEEQLSLRGILAAARKSAQAAALIQAALRARSFQLRQSQTTSDENLEASTNVVALVSLKKAPKMSHFSDYLHSAAAVRIQQKFRGWKGRKEFLKIRNRIVKIQAHVRGHQVRKIYRKVVWSVGIVEKAILRWRRKRIGLRGFRAEIAVGNVENESRKMDEYDHLRDGRKQKVAGVENALARVHSMVRNPEARDQYMRLVTKFQKFKMEDEKSSSQQPLPDNLENDIKEEDLLPLMTT